MALLHVGPKKNMGAGFLLDIPRGPAALADDQDGQRERTIPFRFAEVGWCSGWGHYAWAVSRHRDVGPSARSARPWPEVSHVVHGRRGAGRQRRLFAVQGPGWGRCVWADSNPRSCGGGWIGAFLVSFRLRDLFYCRLNPDSAYRNPHQPSLTDILVLNSASRQGETSMAMRWIAGLLLWAILFTTTGLRARAAGPDGVRRWETKIVVPTYLAGEPERNPMFFHGRQSQGAQGPVYPYPMYDTLTGKKVDKSYTIVYLENEYLRIGVMPEIGGRLFEGVDKTNNYNFIYRQHVIKPALIGLIGAWVSGGIEWNIPHHHRASTFIPVQYQLEEGADGAKTVWVGELELRDRMRWAVGYTLRPGSSVLETSLRIINRTPESNTMLCFANAAVHANENYQVIFPPSTQFGVHHAKREFVDWPIAHSTYGGADFSKGVDISWYKNHITANSVFAWNYQDDFVAGYDHGKQAGTMSVADHHIVPGKKFWTWGNGPSGRRWDSILTDDDGPYIELMVGSYSDNQPDYSWLAPYETRSFSTNWYPFRDIGGVKNANLDAAVNLEVREGSAKVGFYSTAAHPNARVLLSAGTRTLLEKTVAIDPGKPFVEQVALPAGTDEHDLVASLWDGERELISYRPIRYAKQDKPAVVAPPPPPSEVKSVEELYLIGLRARQFHSPTVNPLDYWEEALRREPEDSRVNTAMGIAAFRQARYAEAERYLRIAVKRITTDYTSPKDGEPVYYLGATLQASGKLDEAANWLNKATWNQEWKSAAYFSLAQIASTLGEWNEALRHANHAIENNALHVRAQNLKAAILRQLHRDDEALQVLSAARELDPLDVRAMAERYLASKSSDSAKTLATAMNLHPATAQETAAEYLREGLWRDGEAVLKVMAEAAPEKARMHAMPYYYLGYFAEKQGRKEEAVKFYERAMGMPADYVFPFQPEAIEVLRQAMRSNPADARAPYYLGNLLYDWQPAEAIRLWEASAALDPSFAITHRNLAVAYMHLPGGPDTTKAMAALEKAVSAKQTYALHFAELDELYEAAGASVEKRLALFEKNEGVVALRDDAMNRMIAMKVASGQFDDAIRTMSSRTFAVAEGANLNVVEHWIDAHVMRARQRIGAKRFEDALRDLRSAGTTPDNLPVGSMEASGSRAAELAYWTGIALEELGKSNDAKESFARAAAPVTALSRRRPGQAEDALASLNDQSYYRALASRKLGRDAEARALLIALLQQGKKAQESASKTPASNTDRRQDRSSARTRAANAYYLAGLAQLGLNRQTDANMAFRQALQSRPDHLGARMATVLKGGQ